MVEACTENVARQIIEANPKMVSTWEKKRRKALKKAEKRKW